VPPEERGTLLRALERRRLEDPSREEGHRDTRGMRQSAELKRRAGMLGANK